MAQPEVASTKKVAQDLAEKWRLDKHLDEDPLLAADRDDLVPSQKAVKEFVKKAWPVGSIYISVTATDPADTIGFGTWAAFGAGRVLVGLDAGDADFDTAEETGGAKTKAISAHAGAAVAEHADHTHQVTSNVVASTTNIATAAGATAVGTGLTNNEVISSGASVTLTHTVTQPNAHSDLNVVQPYVVVYFWKRTA